VTFTDPPEGATVSGVIVPTAAASDISGYAFSIDGVPWGFWPCCTSSGLTGWPTTGFANHAVGAGAGP
jgi:hypothetical protein